MAYGDRINAIKQDWIDDILEMLRELAGDPALELSSLSKMTSGDLLKLSDSIDTIRREYLRNSGGKTAK